MFLGKFSSYFLFFIIKGILVILHIFLVGTKALNKIQISTSSNISNGGGGVSFVTIFTVYNSSVDVKSRDAATIVGRVSYNKVERSMAVLNTFINFIQVLL